MPREQKLTAIYKEIANKKVSFGCRYMHDGYRYTVDDSNYRLKKEWNSYCLYIGSICNCPIEIVEQYNEYKNYWVVEIIWHPVMIGTIFERYSSSRWFINAQFVMELIDKWTGYDNPIDDQAEECIDYVYSLIKKS